MIDERIISKAIVDRFFEKFRNTLNIDVAVVGAGPSGMVCAMTLANKGYKVSIFERKLSPGGGIWGGGMMFNEVVLPNDLKDFIEHLGINITDYDENYFTIDSVEFASSLIYNTVHSGVKLFNLMSVEDVLVYDGRISGLVLQWSTVEMANLHVDPLVVKSYAVLDGTGHPAEVANLIVKKMDMKLRTPSGRIEGERSMWAEKGEEMTVENTREIVNGCFVSGMAANAVYGGYRMGPIFGGMIKSGLKAAELIEEYIKRFKENEEKNN